MYMFPSNSKVKILVSYVIVLGGETSGKGLGHEGGTLKNAIGDTTELSCPFSHVRTQPEVWGQKGGHTPHHAGTLTSDFQFPEL